MTLLSRRKRRTTVRSNTRATAAAKAALLLTLFAAPALAQPPGTQPQPLTGGNLQPGYQPGGTQLPNTQPGGLPLPPGYRPRTPPPQSQPQVRPASGGAPGSAGTVMYFQKQADALTVSGGGLPVGPGDGVAQLNDPGRAAPSGAPSAVPDVVPTRPMQPYQRPAAGTGSSAVRTGFASQPAPLPPDGMTTTSDKKKQENQPPPVDPREIQLPSRDKIFGIVYNDAELEKAIMTAILRDQKIYNPTLVIPPESLVFPPLPVINPPGLAYQPKTLTYGPRTLYIEPSYVVHRRLHFEDRNAERQGWDLGPLSTAVSIGYFYRDVMLWPQRLVSGFSSGFWDTSAGKCLPGTPSPYYLYPPGLTLSGSLAEAGIITGFSFLLP